MKKIILSVAVIVAIGFTSCTSEKKVEKKEEVKVEEVQEVTKEEMHKEDMAAATYQCPMKCEGDKTYTDKDAKCPKCNMALKEVKHEKMNMDESHEEHKH